MTGLLAVAAGLLGAIVASFINALSFRWGTGVSILHGRSRCMRCGHTLGAADLVPVFSYVFLRARCRYCGSSISWQYPLVECVGALLGVVVFFAHQEPSSFAFWFVVWMVLLFVTVYDIKHTVIPWSCSIALALLGLASILLFGTPDVLSFVAGPVLALPLTFISAISWGRWMGWGDGALMLGLGWLLGLTAGLTALMLGFWIGAAVGIAALAVSKRYKMNSEVPFAPFLILGAFVAHFCHVDLFSTIPLLFT